MAKKTVADMEVKGKRVLMRVDFNVPLDKQGEITDERRIRMALPSIKSVLNRGGRLILMSHLGRPKGKVNKELSLAPAAKRLGELLGKKVELAGDCVGAEAKRAVEELGDGQCLLLENLRFHEGETKNDPAFAAQLADLAELYVNDAFGTAHRKHASMYGVPEKLGAGKRVCGFLIQKELEFLGQALENPARPFLAILGGVKVSDKIPVIENLIKKVDAILIGGAMSYTFLQAQGIEVGNSKLEKEMMGQCRELLSAAEQAGCQMLVPSDHVVGREVSAQADRTVQGPGIEEGWFGLDIGPATAKAYAGKIATAKTIVWNGPMGVFETPPFDAGTRAVGQAVADADCTSIIGGGDSAAAVEAFGLEDKMSHISTGGGASLEFLAGKPFAALEILDDA